MMPPARLSLDAFQTTTWQLCTAKGLAARDGQQPRTMSLNTRIRYDPHVLHVLNGDSTRLGLEQSSVPGTFVVWADALHEGPVPAGLSDDELAALRARHFAALMHEPAEGVLQMALGWNRALSTWSEFDEVVFWLEHDLFDQLILIRHLHWLTTIHTAGTPFSLICIGSFPGMPGFAGLGELSPAQLASLLDQRTPVTRAQMELGREGWRLYRDPDPLPLFDWSRGNLSTLPFLAGALQRHFEDYPSSVDGLSRSERQILTALRGGAQTFAELFRECQAMEERVFMGDVTFWSIVERLASCRNPLVTMNEREGNMLSPSLRVTLDDLSEVVLDGGADHVELNGIDRWMGGVHLSPSNLWRWDNAAQALTRDE
jgi:hypothetical protein